MDYDYEEDEDDGFDNFDDEIEEPTVDEQVIYVVVRPVDPAGSDRPEWGQPQQILWLDPWHCDHQQSMCQGCLDDWLSDHLVQVPAQLAHLAGDD